jgi:tetratricopeptide (TPR) repeat protein
MIEGQYAVAQENYRKAIHFSKQNPLHCAYLHMSILGKLICNTWLGNVQETLAELPAVVDLALKQVPGLNNQVKVATRCAEVFLLCKEYRKAYAHAELALATPDLHIDTKVPLLNIMASCYLAFDDVPNAEIYATKAKQFLQEDNAFDDNPIAADTKHILGEIEASRYKFKDALDLHQAALKIREVFFDKNHPDVWSSKEAIARIHMLSAKTDAVDYLMFNCHTPLKKIQHLKCIKFQSDHWINISTNQVFAELSARLGNAKALEQIIDAILLIAKTAYGEGHLELARSWLIAGDCMALFRRFDLAYDYHMMALKIYAEAEGTKHPWYLRAYHESAEDLIKLGRYDDAKLQLDRYFKVIMTLLPNDESKKASIFMLLAEVQSQMGDLQGAIQVLLNCVGIEEKKGRSLALAKIYQKIGFIYLKNGQYEEGSEYSTKALEINRELEGGVSIVKFGLLNGFLK